MAVNVFHNQFEDKGDETLLKIPSSIKQFFPRHQNPGCGMKANGCDCWYLEERFQKAIIHIAMMKVLVVNFRKTWSAAML